MIVQKYRSQLIRPLELSLHEGSIVRWFLHVVCSMILWILWARFKSSIIQHQRIALKCSHLKIVLPCTRAPRMATVMTFLKYSHLPVVSTHEYACQYSCFQNVIHYCIETLPSRTCTYVVRVLLLVRYCPLKCGSGAAYVLFSIQPLGVPYVLAGPLIKQTL